MSDDLLENMKRAPALASKAIQDGADAWHEKVLPLHFKRDAHDKYGYSYRTEQYTGTKKRNYSKWKKHKSVNGYWSVKGDNPDLVLSGSLRRDLRAKAVLVASATAKVELRMTARVLNFVPNMPQDSMEMRITQKNGHGYPNLKREIKLITDNEKEWVADIITASLVEAFSRGEFVNSVRPLSLMY